MNFFDFNKVPVKTRVIYGFLLATLTCFFWFLSSLLLEGSDYGLPAYILMFVVMFFIGFTTIRLKVN